MSSRPGGRTAAACGVAFLGWLTAARAPDCAKTVTLERRNKSPMAHRVLVLRPGQRRSSSVSPDGTCLLCANLAPSWLPSRPAIEQLGGGAEEPGQNRFRPGRCRSKSRNWRFPLVRRGRLETGILRYTNHRPYLPGPVRLGIFRSPFTTGGKSFTSSYTSVINRSLLCFVSPSVVAS
jgi:hypothetical protein